MENRGKKKDVANLHQQNEIKIITRSIVKALNAHPKPEVSDREAAVVARLEVVRFNRPRHAQPPEADPKYERRPLHANPQLTAGRNHESLGRKGLFPNPASPY